MTVTWDSRKKEVAYDGSSTKNVDCSHNGKWYVIRYEQGKPANEYTLLKSLNGDVSTFEVTDSDIEYDKKYVYRVIFLPDILESTYKDKLTQLPGYQRSRNDYDLWMEKEVETKLDVNIQLSQDMKYTEGVRLKWSYSIEQAGLTWQIDYRTANSDESWQTRSEAPGVDTNKSEASIEFESSGPCDLKEYRVRVTVNGRDFYSNIASTSVPDSTYISEVVASTGTEESSVTVKWKVVSPDRQYDIWYRVLRRVIGDSEWTLLTDDKHGTASEYTFTDTRAVAGSYYEYSVEAYGAQC